MVANISTCSQNSITLMTLQIIIFQSTVLKRPSDQHLLHSNMIDFLHQRNNTQNQRGYFYVLDEMTGNLNGLTICVFFFFFLMALKKPCFSFSLVGSGGFMTIASAADLRGKWGKKVSYTWGHLKKRQNLNNTYTIWKDMGPQIIPLAQCSLLVVYHE